MNWDWAVDNRGRVWFTAKAEERSLVVLEAGRAVATYTPRNSGLPNVEGFTYLLFDRQDRLWIVSEPSPSLVVFDPARAADPAQLELAQRLQSLSWVLFGVPLAVLVVVWLGRLGWPRLHALAAFLGSKQGPPLVRKLALHLGAFLLAGAASVVGNVVAGLAAASSQVLGSAGWETVVVVLVVINLGLIAVFVRKAWYGAALGLVVGIPVALYVGAYAAFFMFS
jgi:hypothetical protein